MWLRILLICIGAVVIGGGITIACVLDKDAGAFECHDCHNRFVPDTKSYVMSTHTITKRKYVFFNSTNSGTGANPPVLPFSVGIWI